MKTTRQTLLSALAVLLLAALLFPLASAVQAAEKPVTPREGVAQLQPTATITARTASALAGPSRGFWSISLLRRGNILPLVGKSADGKFWAITTTAGVAFIEIDQAAVSDPNVPVIDPGPYGFFTVPRAIVRADPGIEARAISNVSNGMAFYIIGSRPDGDWLNIRFRFGTGWVQRKVTNLATNGTGSKSPVPITVTNAVAIVNAGALNVRAGPGNTFRSLGTVPGGTEMIIIGRTVDGLWIEVISPFGLGWVRLAHVITRNYNGSVTVFRPNDPNTPAFTASADPLVGRRGPGLGFDVTLRGTPGSKYVILAQSANGWWFVSGTNGIGWVPKDAGTATGNLSTVPTIQ